MSDSGTCSEDDGIVFNKSLPAKKKCVTKSADGSTKKEQKIRPPVVPPAPESVKSDYMQGQFWQEEVLESLRPHSSSTSPQSFPSTRRRSFFRTSGSSSSNTIPPYLPSASLTSLASTIRPPSPSTSRPSSTGTSPPSFPSTSQQSPGSTRQQSPGSASQQSPGSTSQTCQTKGKGRRKSREHKPDPNKGVVRDKSKARSSSGGHGKKKPEIIDARKDESGGLVYVLQFSDSEEPEELPAEQAKAKYLQQIIHFWEDKRTTYRKGKPCIQKCV